MKRRKIICWVCLIFLFGMFFLTACGKAESRELVELRLGETALVAVEDPDDVQSIKDLLSGAEDIGYEPKTYMLGPDLVYTDEDGKSVVLELDLDSDLFRYNGRFFDYGPGNDNNAIPKLWELLGLTAWPEEVQAAYPEFFAAVGEMTFPTEEEETHEAHLDLWYPDWAWLGIRAASVQSVLDAILAADPQPTDQTMPAVEETIYTLHIAYDDGREYDLACIGEGEFLLWISGTDQVYSLGGQELQAALDNAISASVE